MRLNREQLDILSHYFADLSKILFASTVVSFFIPTKNTDITLVIFLAGASITAFFILLSVLLLNTKQIS